MQLSNIDNAAQIFFTQAAREELSDRPRLMIPRPGGGFAPMTWAELSDRVQRLTSFLIDRGVDAGSKVAVLSQTRMEWGLSALATMAARGTLVPVYPSLTAEQLGHVVGHSEASVLVVETADNLRHVLEVWDRLALGTVICLEAFDVQQLAKATGRDPDAIASVTFPLTQAEALGLSSLEREPRRVLARTAEIALEDVAYLVYTSGTTGMPKGVPLTHGNVGASGADWMQANGELVGQGNVDILWLPMSHLYGLGQFFLGNQVGFVTYLSDPMSALGQLAEVRPHVFMAVPAYWEKLMRLAQSASTKEAGQLARLEQLTGGRLHFCLSGGAGLAREVKEFFLRAGVLIIEGYGLTECSPNLTMNRADDFDFDSVGKPVASVRIKIAKDGEILAKGPNVFGGYYKDPAATRAVFDEAGWLHTGDLGRFNERGFLQIVGRKKEIIVTSGGKNIPPANIEQRFTDNPLIANLMVYGDGKKYLTALVDIDETVAEQLLRGSGLVIDGALREHPQVRAWIASTVDEVNGQLASFETIKAFCIASEPLTVESGLLTPTLKLKRQQICARYGARLDALYR